MSNFIGTFKCTRGGETMGTSGKVAKMTINVRSPMKNRDTDEYDSYFFDVICFGKNIDKCLSVNKGDFVGVVGSVTTNKYTNKDGVEKITPQIVADQIIPQGFTKTSAQPENGSAQIPTNNVQPFVPPVDDSSTALPFDI